MFEDYKTKKSVVVVYTGEGKGKTSAALGLVGRALGTGWNVAFIQFIKHWEVGEHLFLKNICEIYPTELEMIRGGKGFFAAGGMSAAGVSEQEHKAAASETFQKTLEAVKSGKFQLVVCDEINNAVNDGLISQKDLEKLFRQRHPDTSLCLTGRNFPKELLKHVDIATEMKKIKHHYDDKFLANKGIDY